MKTIDPAKQMVMLRLSREQLVWAATALDMVDLSLAGVTLDNQVHLKQVLLEAAKKGKQS